MIMELKVGGGGTTGQCNADEQKKNGENRRKSFRRHSQTSIELYVRFGFAVAFSGAPEEPFLVQDGKRVHPGNNVVAKENHTVTVECIARRAVPEVKQVFWSLGPDHINVTGNSELKIDFVSHEDSYTTKSILRLNTTRAMNHQKVTCHVFHVAWPNASVVSASLNVLCEYYTSTHSHTI